jgi:hypothetical protein
VVLGEVDDEYRRLVDEVGVELGVAEPGGGRVQRGVGEIQAREPQDGFDVKPGDLGGDRDVVGEAEGLRASMSRSSDRLRSLGEGPLQARPTTPGDHAT